MKTYDYIIAGAGASGLMMAYRMVSDTYFDNTRILLIDHQKKSSNDRTWCYWTKNEEDDWDALVYKQWDHLRFASPMHSQRYPIAPYTYKMIRSQAFYKALWKKIDSAPQLTFALEKVVDIRDTKQGVCVQTNIGSHIGNRLINSVLWHTTYQNQQKYPILQQHFLGWFIKTKSPAFDPNTATFMDFEIPQHGNTRFMYVLPLSETEALIEYTLFSKKILAVQEYETAIEKYLAEKGITDFELLEKEKGAIPMSSYPFDQLNTKNIFHIGTAGGWTKASTGYTFRNTTQKTAALLTFLKEEKKDLSRFYKRNRFWYYDLLLLDVLAKHNGLGASLFSRMFKHGNVHNILKFLDEETHFLEELKTIWSMPKWPFVQALFSRMLGRIIPQR